MSNPGAEVHRQRKIQRIAIYNQSPKKCKHCNGPIDYDRKINQYCSHSCSASHINSGRPVRSAESCNKTKESLKGFINQRQYDEWAKIGIFGPYTRLYTNVCNQCNSIFVHRRKKKTCSEKCQYELQGQWLSKNRSHIGGNGRKSYMEESFSKWLESNFNGKWYSELHVKNKENGKHMWPDFIFPRLKLIIELDGTHHLKRVEVDKIRDEYLTRTRGYEVIRITQSEYIKKSKLALVCDKLKLVGPPRLELGKAL